MNKNFFDLGYVRASAVSPKIFLGKPMENAKHIVNLAIKEKQQGSFIIVFPELSLTGYSCEDLFLTQDLLNQSNAALQHVISETREVDAVIVVGHPYQAYTGNLYNCATVLYRGKIMAMIPKSYLPVGSEFYEARWWTPGLGVNLEIEDFAQKFTLSPNQIINFNNRIILGVDVCEDLFAPIPPSTNLALNGANIILNLSASNELTGKVNYRRELVSQQSAKLNAAYIYAAASPWESTKDLVMGGHCLIQENGTLLAEGERFSFEDQAIRADIDVQKLALERRRNKTFGQVKPTHPVKVISANTAFLLKDLQRTYPKNPFIPSNPATLAERSEEILQIQSTGLARRMKSIGEPKLVLGLSGGLDSTLALLVCLEAVKKAQQPVTDIVCYSMPGFGTTKRTRDQAARLAEAGKVTFSEIDITATVKSHFKDIGHDENNFNFVYENAQARERTQILFDQANALGGLVVGTGDWSEQALSFMTYSGDHLSNYNVNSSIPKTLVQHLIKYYKDNRTQDDNFINVLQNVLDTKISPELLPPDKAGNISQSTEEIVGPYILNDFMLFHYARNAFTLEKIYTLACITFKDDYSPEIIKKWMDACFDRFKKGQFKRTVSPPGPMVGLSWSSRGWWRMPDEN